MQPRAVRLQEGKFVYNGGACQLLLVLVSLALVRLDRGVRSMEVVPPYALALSPHYHLPPFLSAIPFHHQATITSQDHHFPPPLFPTMNALYDDDHDASRLRAADLDELAKQRQAELLREGRELHPVTGNPRSKNLARHFWGKAWMRHLAHCEAGGLCLAPGRTLLRHGCVLDLRVGQGCIEALVSAQEIYEVTLRVRPLDGDALDALRAVCQGKVASHIALLEGRLDEALLECLCDPEQGLLPTPSDWRMRCSCPEWAEPCPHAAAAIYAAGVLIDADPALLFTLRSFVPQDLVQAVPGTGSLKQDAEKLSALFGIDLDTE